jgi:superoxide dismutase, Cu-Zn family
VIGRHSRRAFPILRRGRGCGVLHRMMKTAAGVFGLCLLAGACGGDDEEETMTAAATIAPTTGNTVMGTVTFTKGGGDVSLSLSVTMATEGMHGVHIHQVGACGTDGADAGGHWDGGTAAGEATTHGLPGGAMEHLGDLGNITVSAAGTGSLSVSKAEWTLGDGAATDVVGKSIIFHASPDDGTMASSGARAGCGVIALSP